MIKFNEMFPCEIVTVNENKYMFTNARVDRATIPESLLAYDVRDNCDGVFCEIKKSIFVNHWGTIVGVKELPLEDGLYCCTFDDGGFEGVSVKNAGEYLDLLNE